MDLDAPVVYASTASGQVFVGSSGSIGDISASLGLSTKKADVYSAYVAGRPVRTKVAEALHIASRRSA